MPVNSTHCDYDLSLVQWSRARDVLAGEDSVKGAGVRYLPQLDSQTEEEYCAYKSRESDGVIAPRRFMRLTSRGFFRRLLW
jgi:hypothetical protein